MKSKLVLLLLIFLSNLYAKNVVFMLSSNSSKQHEAREGFQEEFEQNYPGSKFSVFFYKKKEQELIREIKAVNPDLIVPILSKATKFAIKHFSDKLICFTMLSSTDDLDLEEKNGGKINGVVSEINDDLKLDYLVSVLGEDITIVAVTTQKKWGEANQLFEAAKKYRNVKFKSFAAENPQMTIKTLQKVKEKSLFWMFYDRKIYTSSRVINEIFRELHEKDVLILAPTQILLKYEYYAHMSISVEPRENGAQSAKLAIRKLEKPDNENTIEMPEKIRFYVNKNERSNLNLNETKIKVDWIE